MEYLIVAIFTMIAGVFIGYSIRISPTSVEKISLSLDTACGNLAKLASIMEGQERLIVDLRREYDELRHAHDTVLQDRAGLLAQYLVLKKQVETLSESFKFLHPNNE